MYPSSKAAGGICYTLFVDIDSFTDTSGWRSSEWNRGQTGFYNLSKSKRRPSLLRPSVSLRKAAKLCIEASPALKTPPNNNQVVGNVGLFYVCYQLSKRGWNVMPTARNARGIDILIYSQEATRTHTVQVKALSRRSPVPLGTKLEGLFGDFFIICRNVALDSPECFVLTPAEFGALLTRARRTQNELLAPTQTIRDCRFPRPVAAHRQALCFHNSRKRANDGLAVSQSLSRGGAA